MTVLDFEALFRAAPAGEEAERSWDARSEQFNAAQKTGGTFYPDSMVALLESAGLLNPAASILEIGAGSGRYSLAFARKARRVLATDISSRMLGFLKANAAEAGISNIECAKVDWAAVDATREPFSKAFDLAFAAMCPAVRSAAGLDRMTSSARKACVVAQFIEHRDPVLEAVSARTPESGRRDPHNDRDALFATFNILHLKGLDPEISYIRERASFDYSVDEAIEHYAPRVRGGGSDKDAVLRDAVASLASGGRVKLTEKSTLAVVVWRTHEL